MAVAFQIHDDHTAKVKVHDPRERGRARSRLRPIAGRLQVLEWMAIRQTYPPSEAKERIGIY